MSRSRLDKAPSQEAWRSLRALLVGAGDTLAPSESVANAAIVGQVELLALEAEPRLATWLEEASARRREQGLLVSFAEERVMAVLQDASVEAWVALKGSSAGHTIYADPLHRARRDVDILVHPHDIPALIASVEAAGWPEVTHASHRAGISGGPQEREFLIPIGNSQVACDVHRRLLRWSEFPVDVTGILSRAESLETGWRVCAPSDLLIHTALHAANSAFDVPLRSWLDVHRVASSPALDWDEVVRCATAWQARRCVWAALRVAQQWFGTAVPIEVLTALNPTGFGATRLAATLVGQGRWPTHQPPTGRVRRARTRVLVRDSASSALWYVWQTAVREFVLLCSGRG